MPENQCSRWVRLSEYGTDQIVNERTHTILPANLIFPYGKRVPLASFADMLVAVANWLIDTKKIKRGDCPVNLPLSRENCLINAQPVHPDGTAMHSPRLLKNGWHLNANYNAPDTVKHCRQLLTMFGVEPKRIRVQRTVKLPERHGRLKVGPSKVDRA